MTNIRQVTHDDVEAIVSIENRSFSAPFTKEMFYAMIIASPPFGGLVAFEGEILLGYLFYTIAADEMELLTIATNPARRHEGNARKLLEEMFEIAKRSGVVSVFLEVRPTNISAQSLYRSFGFQEISIRKKYYKDNGEDAIVMRKSI